MACQDVPIVQVVFPNLSLVLLVFLQSYKSVRAGLGIPSNLSSVPEPWGNLNVMLSMHMCVNCKFVLEKGPNFISVRTLFTAAIPLVQWIAQPSKYHGTRMPPNITNIFNYWGICDKVGEIGLITGSIHTFETIRVDAG
jgi:hypothetical protein